jgi:TolA-binding protein
MGKCHEAQGKQEEAQKAYREVVEKYGDTRWGALAKERL